MNHPVLRNKTNRQKKYNAIVNNAVDEILLNKAQKVSSVREASECLESDYDEN